MGNADKVHLMERGEAQEVRQEKEIILEVAADCQRSTTSAIARESRLTDTILKG